MNILIVKMEFVKEKSNVPCGKMEKRLSKAPTLEKKDGTKSIIKSRII